MKKEINYYKVYFPHPDFRLYDIISWLMGLMAVIVFAKYILAASDNTFVFSRYWIILICIIGFLIFKYFQAGSGRVVSYSVVLFVCGLFFFTISRGTTFLIVIGLLYVIAAMAERSAKSLLEVEFDEDEIVIKKLFRKHEPWRFVNNVMLKEGVLTIDYKNNKIFQKEIADDVSPELEKEFNEFCRAQLQAHGSKLAVN